VGVLAGREVRPAGSVSLPHKGGDPPWRLPALHPLVQGETENRDTGIPGRPKTKAPGGEALANQESGISSQSSEQHGQAAGLL
jgi:hypothetical protein